MLILKYSVKRHDFFSLWRLARQSEFRGITPFRGKKPERSDFAGKRQDCIGETAGRCQENDKTSAASTKPPKDRDFAGV